MNLWLFKTYLYLSTYCISLYYLAKFLVSISKFRYADVIFFFNSIRIFSLAAFLCVLGVLPLNYFGQDMLHVRIPSASLETFTIGNVQERSRWWAMELLLQDYTCLTLIAQILNMTSYVIIFSWYLILYCLLVLVCSKLFTPSVCKYLSLGYYSSTNFKLSFL